MIVILDASTLINLANGEVFRAVISLPSRSFLVNEIVLQESRTVARAIQAAIKRGHIAWVDSNLIDVEEYQEALRLWCLGPGETECFLAARVLGCLVACDDGAACKVIRKNVPAIGLTGSIGLLREAMAEGILSAEQAYNSYQLMRTRGGYLPSLRLSDFEGFRLSQDADRAFPDATDLEI